MALFLSLLGESNLNWASLVGLYHNMFLDAGQALILNVTPVQSASFPVESRVQKVEQGE